MAYYTRRAPYRRGIWRELDSNIHASLEFFKLSGHFDRSIYNYNWFEWFMLIELFKFIINENFI